MVSPSSNAEKYNHAATTSATTTTSNTSLSPGVDPNNPSAIFDFAPSPTPITEPVEPSSDSTTDSPISAADDASGSTSKKKGRGKVELKKMEKESNLLVTFSKRRAGLFKKANELCILCGVQCALVVFSPARKLFSFGHPSVDSVVDRYLAGNLINPVHLHEGDQMPQNQVVGDHPLGADTENLTAKLTDLMDAFDVAKKNSLSLDKRRAERRAKHWWANPVQQMDLVQLDTLKRAMTNLKLKVYEQVGMRMNISASSSSSSPGTTFQRFNHNYPSINGTAGSSINGLPFAGFPRWSNNLDSSEAGPSGRSNGGNSGEGSGSGAI